MEKSNFFEKRIERMHNVIEMVPTKIEDIDLIISWESKEPNIISWTKEKHESIINNPQFLHLLISKRGDNIVPVGYSILEKDSPDELSLEFVRLVISDEYKNRGYGVLAFENIWELAFDKLKYSRIWHDVFIENEKAINLYEKLGYKKFKTSIDLTSGRDLIFYEMSNDDYFSREKDNNS